VEKAVQLRAGATIPVRGLRAADIPACLVLTADRDWIPEPRKWSLLLDVGEGYGIDDPDGGLAGAVVLIRYGDTLASAAMMLVATRRGGRGLGRALMSHLLDQAGGATVFLHATEYGRPLYEKLGFRPWGTVTRMTGRFQPLADDPQQQTRAAAEQDVAAIIGLDADVYGADRGRLLRRLLPTVDQVRVLERNQEIVGYAAAWRGASGAVIGPVIAADDSAARMLVTDVATGVDDPLRIDPDPTHPDLAEWMGARGMSPTSASSFMVYGAWPRGDRSRLFAPVNVALG